MQDSKKRHNKERSKAYFQRRADQIRALNPRIFDMRKPSVLAKTIKDQILKADPTLTKSVVNKFLSFWVKRDRYLSATIACPSRMNLDGTFAEAITQDEKMYAQSVLRTKRKGRTARTSKSHNKQQVKKLSPSEVNLRQRNILEKAGRGLNFPIQQDKPAEIEIRVKKRKTLKLPKRVDGKGGEA